MVLIQEPPSSSAAVGENAADHQEAWVVGRRCVCRLLGDDDDGVFLLPRERGMLLPHARATGVFLSAAACVRWRAKRSVQSNEEESHKLLDYYVEERGGNFLDVAEMYPAVTSAMGHICWSRCMFMYV